jgi:Sporulation related domain.
MRWIFFSLLILNIVALAWGFVVRSSSVGDVGLQPENSSSTNSGAISSLPFKGAAALVLLGEAVGDDLPDRNPIKGVRPSVTSLEDSGLGESEVAAPESDTPQGATIPMRDGKPLCEMVGAFAGRDAAEGFVERLAATYEIDSAVHELELPAGSRYQVYLVPEDSYRSALRRLSELQAKKVDSYIIPSGEFENGISLGMFSQEKLAKQHVADMKAIGLSPRLKVIERTYWEIWVMLNPGEGGKMTNLAWERVLEGLDLLERRQNFCLDVAS